MLAFYLKKLYVNIHLAKTITGRYNEYKGVGRGSEVVYDKLGGAVTKKGWESLIYGYDMIG